jgi:site-specific recombinase XerD
MTPLRQKMIEAMRVRGFSERTHQSYLAAVTDLARFYARAPDQIRVEEIPAYFKSRILERNWSGSSCRVSLNAFRFFYRHVLGQPPFDTPIAIPKKAQRIPDLLTRKEVARIVGACRSPKHRTVLLTCYGCGLRVSELVALKVHHIDGERHLLRVEQGKGAKDRNVIISDTLLAQLREYWKVYHPIEWLFPGREPTLAMSIETAQHMFTQAKRRAGVNKIGGIHALRHAYATHQLDGGVPAYQLQQLLGHQSLRTTERYVHWIAHYRPGSTASSDLVAALGVDHD